ncbi:hypothetical protein ACNOYE_36505 [Nannocystaceae bacterium ST9]
MPRSMTAAVLLLAASSFVGLAWAGPPDPSEPVEAIDEARVAAVELDATIWRGGEQPPGRKRIPKRRAEVEGQARYRLSEPARAGQALVLLDFAEILTELPRELDEIALSTYVSGAREYSRTDVLAVVDDRGRPLEWERRGSRRDLVVELPAGLDALTIEYRVAVPHRYWPLGCVWRRCSLAGAAAPLPSEPARGGVWLPPGGRVPSPVEWTILGVRFGSVPDWQPGSEPTPEQAKALSDDELIVSASALEPDTPIAYPSIYWGPRWHRTEQWIQGVRVRVFHIDPRPGDVFPTEKLMHPIADVAGHAQAIAGEAIDLAAAVGIAVPPDTALTIVQGPLRSDIAQFHPTSIALSDQYLELLRTKRFAKFHDVVLARTVFDMFGYGHFAGHHDASTDLWLSGALGVALTQLWQRRRELRDEYAGDLLASFTFVPAIDRFLYTGQAAFSSAYFRGSEDEMPIRVHPLFFANALPTGRRIHEKLSDLMPELELGRFYTRMIADPDRDPVTTLEQVWGHELHWFFEQWLGDYPEVDWAVERVVSEPRSDGGYRTTITVVRDADRPMIEPVQVYVVERGGAEHFLVWNGEAAPGEPLLDQPRVARHRFEIDTARKLAVVRIDPRNRIVQTSRVPVGRFNRGNNNDPLFNDRRPAKARFVYSGFGFAVAASEFRTALASQDYGAAFNSLSLLAAFETSLRRDLRETFNFTAFSDRETWVGGGAALNLWFGEKRNRQRRRTRLRFGGTGSWLTQSGLDRRGGLRLTESVGLFHDTRKYGLAPERGYMLGASVTASQVVRLESGQNDDRYSLDFDVGWAQSFPLAHHHVLATRLDASIVVPIGSQPEFRSLNRGGGIGGLTGFTSNELFGRGLLIAALEYRHTIIDDLRIPLLNFLWLRSIGGVAFGGVASLSSCDSLKGWFGRDSWYGYYGYGLTANMQIFGVTPQFIRIDVSAPIGRESTECMGQLLPNYIARRRSERTGEPYDPDLKVRLPPVNVNVSFNQPF